MKKKKKLSEMTSQEKYQHYKKVSTILIVFKYIAIALPFIIIGSINFRPYFMQADGLKVGIGFALSSVVMVIAIIREANKDTKKKFSNLMVWVIAFALTLLCESIMSDLSLILGCGLGGQVIATALGLVADNQKKIADMYKEGIISAETTVEAQEEAKKEV